MSSLTVVAVTAKIIPVKPELWVSTVRNISASEVHIRQEIAIQELLIRQQLWSDALQEALLNQMERHVRLSEYKSD